MASTWPLLRVESDLGVSIDEHWPAIERLLVYLNP